MNALNVSALVAVVAAIILAATYTTFDSRPKVHLDSATFFGVRNGSTAGFYGIPFAQPPVGKLRFSPPQRIGPYSGTHHSTAFGPACIQQAIQPDLRIDLPNATMKFFADFAASAPKSESEDCLTLNVIAPANATVQDRLPVVVWIYGGSFQIGSASSYNGTAVVDLSIQVGEPIIYVSINYRVSAYGFLIGKEAKAAGAGNLGLRDQREAFRWIQKYIEAFGGDPGRVTIWGESAGAMSVALQMVTNDGDTEGLFHAAFMQSGSTRPAADITDGQAYYDALVRDAGCAAASDSLECLRSVDLDILRVAVNKSPSAWAYRAFASVWRPRVDDVFLKDNPQRLLADGRVASVPMVSGSCDDEGTLFALSSLNVTTDADFADYISAYFAKNTSPSDLADVLAAYPSDITQGSPFDTGLENALTPQSKRIAAFLGDFSFQAWRRHFLQQRSGMQPTWSYLHKRAKALPVIGAAHGTDLAIFGPSDLTRYLIAFVNHHDPNGRQTGAHGDLHWPRYTPDTPNMLVFSAGNVTQATALDTYRKEAMDTLMRVA